MVNNFKQKTQSYIACRNFFGGTRKAGFYFFNKTPSHPEHPPSFFPIFIKSTQCNLISLPVQLHFLSMLPENFFFFFCLQLPRFSDQYTDLGTENSTILNMGIQTRQKMKTHTKNSTILNMGISTKQKSHKKNSTIQI